MKKFFIGSCFALLFFNFALAQSRRVPPYSENNNEKKTKNEPTPTPTPLQPANYKENNFKDDADVIKIDTDLITIPVRISDRQGRFVGNLKKENFQIIENDVPQEIAYFSNEEQPFTVALVLDMSYSSVFKLADIQNAAKTFITLLRPADKVMIVSFDEEVHVLCLPTNNRQALNLAIEATRINSGTSVYRAVDQVLNKELERVAGRKAIVLFTDGVDTTSRKTLAQKNLDDTLEFDALIYPIKYDTYNDVQKVKNLPEPTKAPPEEPITEVAPMIKGTTDADYRNADEYLKELATRTGGRVYKANSNANLINAFRNIASELREYYSIGYYPLQKGAAGEKRRIRVRVNQSGLTVRARDGYVVNN